MVQTEAPFKGPQRRVLRGVVVFRAFGVGRYDVDDPRVFSRENWGATRGKPCSIEGKMSIVWKQG